MRRLPVALLAALALPCPAQPPARNAQIDGLVSAIRAPSIEARVRQLVAFRTRHTLSRADSDAEGIGAARRWIRSELEQCSRAAGGRLHVALDSYVQPPTERIPRPVEIVNVVATLPGSTQRTYVVGAHYDSRSSDVMDARSPAPGADDDASGVAAMMEIACAMAFQRYDATLVFIAFAGEEQHLLGAHHWAEEAKRKRLDIAGMLENDIIGSATGPDGERHDQTVRLFADGLPALLGTPELAALLRSGGEADTPTHELGRYLKEVGERYVAGMTVQLVPRPDRLGRGGDQLAFLERGFPGVRFSEAVEDYRHQHQAIRVENGVQIGDLPQFLDFPYITKVAQVNAAGLASLALAPAPPRDVRIEPRLSDDTALTWRANNESDLEGYRIVWREAGAATWQYSRDVGKVTRTTLAGVSKDDFVFGVAALDHDGNPSPATFAQFSSN